MPGKSDNISTDYVVLPDQNDHDKKKKKKHLSTGASAASVRAVSAQFIAFYFRAPIKAFFRTRFDYTAYARAINPEYQAAKGWSWRMSTPGVLAYAVRQHGFSFIPNQVLPPMLANVTVGAILYTTYLQTLAALHEPSGRSAKRIYPPPAIKETLAAGFVAGTVQSIVAAPLDALQIRFRTNDMLEGNYTNMWNYARHKLHEIGIRGVAAGWSLSLVKDSIGYACFFATFETIKSQAYYEFVRRYYADYKPIIHGQIASQRNGDRDKPAIRPHYAIEPCFLLLAGIGASITSQAIQQPLTKIQDIHYGRLESLDHVAKLEKSHRGMLSRYYQAYEKTIEQCSFQASRAGSWRAWLYKGMLWNTFRQVPSTSAGLIVFELVRRRYATEDDIVRIEKDGYDILLS